MHLQVFSDEEAADFNRNLVPVRFVGSLSSAPDPMSVEQLIPLLQLDTTARPDVADLVRLLHSEELSGQRMPPFIYGGGKHPGALLRIDLTEPVRCSFTVFLRWPDDADVLRLMAATGMLGLFVGAEYQQEYAIGLRVDQNELARVIRVWERRREG